MEDAWPDALGPYTAQNTFVPPASKYEDPVAEDSTEDRRKIGRSSSDDSRPLLRHSRVVVELGRVTRQRGPYCIVLVLPVERMGGGLQALPRNGTGLEPRGAFRADTIDDELLVVGSNKSRVSIYIFFERG